MSMPNVDTMTSAPAPATHEPGTIPQSPPGDAPSSDMVWIPGGTFDMGSDRHYPEERPVHRVTVDGFWIDRSPVTNARFARFCAATHHTTFAELPPNARDYPGAPPEQLKPGSLVFVRPKHAVNLNDISNWWRFVHGADWRHPQGPGTTAVGLDDHPGVHVAYNDAEAFASWERKELPTEAEWEFAARGGLEGAAYAWGDELMPHGRPMANTWQGRFPHENTLVDGWEGTSPVGAFPPNGYGLYDMIGNVWEWTCDWYRASHVEQGKTNCCTPHNPRGGTMLDSMDQSQQGTWIPRKVLKGGSHLCSPNYCQRYRPAARFPEPIDTSTTHLGFRCIVRPSR